MLEMLLFCTFSSWLAAVEAEPEAAQLAVGPYLQAVTDRSAIVLWTTDFAHVGRVRYRLEGGQEAFAGESEASWSHLVRLEALEAGHTYEYTVLDGDRPLHAEPFRFRAAPNDRAASVKVSVLGDSGSGGETQIQVAEILRAFPADLVLHTGDVDYAADIARTLFGVYKDMLSKTPFYFARGNHDTLIKWNEVFPPPNLNPLDKGSIYSFDWGCAHFTAMDTNMDALAGGGQLQWVDEDLAMARGRGAKWLIIFCHEPPYTAGSYGRFKRVAREVVPGLADKYSVDLVLSGHDHNYQRSHPVRGEHRVDAWQNPDFVLPQGTTYLVSGGGGHVLYSEDPRADHQFTRIFVYAHHTLQLEISPEELVGRAVSPALGVIDAFTIRKHGQRPEYRFTRGDTNKDGAVNIGDPVRVLGHLFLGKPLDCDLAADANASGGVALDDAVFLLTYLFLGGPPPATPFPGCESIPEAVPADCTEQGCRS